MCHATAGSVGIVGVVAVCAVRPAPPIVQLDAVGVVVRPGRIAPSIVGLDVGTRQVSIGSIIQFAVCPMPVVGVGVVAAVRVVTRSAAGAIGVVGVNVIASVLILPCIA